MTSLAVEPFEWTYGSGAREKQHAAGQGTRPDEPKINGPRGHDPPPAPSLDVSLRQAPSYARATASYAEPSGAESPRRSEAPAGNDPVAARLQAYVARADTDAPSMWWQRQLQVRSDEDQFHLDRDVVRDSERNEMRHVHAEVGALDLELTSDLHRIAVPIGPEAKNDMLGGGAWQLGSDSRGVGADCLGERTLLSRLAPTDNPGVISS